MIRSLAFLFLFLAPLLLFSGAESANPKPLPAPESFNISYIQNKAGCSYSVVISTSCASVSYTRDKISISFGDAYGNQVYTPRLDDPSTRTFERCSSDTFEINGPCAYQICYMYLYRSGPDGWRPASVEIYGYNSRAVRFYYDIFIPGDTWYGFNRCNSASSSHLYPGQTLLISIVLALVLCFLL